MYNMLTDKKHRLQKKQNPTPRIKDNRLNISTAYFRNTTLVNLAND
jgi:hypothetical protein